MQKNVNTEEMYGNYIKTITSTIEEYAPTLRRKHIKKKYKSWFDEEALKLKVQRRKAKKIWQRRRCELHKRLYLQTDKCYKKHLFQTKKKILRDKLNSGNNKTKTLYKITKSLTSDTSENILPTATSSKELANIFANFFVDKVTKIKSKFLNNENYQILTRNCKILSNFQTITEEELFKTMKSTTSSNDPCNTEFILNFIQILAPVWTNIINKSIEAGTVLKCWKEAVVLPVQKNHNLGTNLTNYWPINHLAFFSKLIEKIILNHLWNHLKQIIYYQINKVLIGQTILLRQQY